MKKTIFRMLASVILTLAFFASCSDLNMMAQKADETFVAIDRDELVIVYAAGDSALSVTNNMTLPVTNGAGTAISWVSSNTAVISNAGVVTRPASDTVVVLTATLTTGGASTDKVFTLTVTGTVVDIAAIQGVTPPALGGTPVTAISETDQYTGTVVWSDADSPFLGDKTYTATITLTAKTGYSLTGVTADFFTVSGATTDTNPADSGVITAVFPVTTIAVIDIAAILGVTPPVVGATRATGITASDQYTGTVTWSPSAGTTFAGSQVYTATITLTAKAGFTLTGVEANFFTVEGVSTAATNSADLGVITAVFPTTNPADITVAGVTGFVAPVPGAAIQSVGALTAGAASYTVTSLTWDPSASPHIVHQVYVATVKLTSTTGYKFPAAGIAVPTATAGGGTVSAGTTGGGNVTGNTLTFTVTFPETEVTYLVTYDANGSTGGTVPSAVSYTTGTTVTVSANSGTLKFVPAARTAEAFKFGGWNTLANGGGTTYAAGSGQFTITADTTLYAKWVPFAVGDTGPGGGIIVYDHGSFVAINGISGTLRYIEAAPSGWSGGADPTSVFSTITNAYAGTGSSMAVGYYNTNKIVVQNSGAASAALVAKSCTSGGLNDWVLPSQGDMIYLYTNRSAIGVSSIYWCSTEPSSDGLWGTSINLDVSGSYNWVGADPCVNANLKTNSYKVHPVRYF